MRARVCVRAHLVQTRPDWRHVTGKYQYQAQKHAHRAPGATNMILVLSLLISFNFCWSPAAEEKRIDRQQDGWRGSRMKERRSFSFGCAKIHELPISIFLLSFSLSLLSQALLSFLSLSLPPSPPLSLSSLSPTSMTHSPSPPLLPPCTTPSSLLGVRAARCQSRRVLGVSRVLHSHRVVWSLA